MDINDQVDRANKFVPTIDPERNTVLSCLVNTWLWTGTMNAIIAFCCYSCSNVWLYIWLNL